MKYGRKVDHDDGDGVVRLVDVVDVPENVDPEAWLSTMFQHQKPDWVENNEWFIPVPDEFSAGDFVADEEFVARPVMVEILNAKKKPKPVSDESANLQ